MATEKRGRQQGGHIYPLTATFCIPAEDDHGSGSAHLPSMASACQAGGRDHPASGPAGREEGSQSPAEGTRGPSLKGKGREAPLTTGGHQPAGDAGQGNAAGKRNERHEDQRRTRRFAHRQGSLRTEHSDGPPGAGRLPGGRHKPPGARSTHKKLLHSHTPATSRK